METLFIGKNAIFLPETESTNSYAITLLKNVNPPEGTVVHTAYQSGGKGQRGSTWQSAALSNLTVSFILKPSFLELKNHFYLYKIAALACFDTLAHFLGQGQYDIKIKWPNDILVNGKKICGILIENGINSGRLKYSVAGIGINLNQEDFPGIHHCTSYKLLTGKVISLKEVLKVLCAQLEKYYLALKQNKFEMIRQIYLTRLYGLENRLAFEVNSVIKHYVVTGVNEGGLLSLKDDDGTEIKADVKEVKWMF